jgi:threonine/homoserine/homoserine lactone efflux protein
MGQAIGSVLSLAVGVALSPIPIVAVVLMLATPRRCVNAPAFVLGWVVGLALVGTIVLLVAGGISASSAGKPKTWVGTLKLGLGVLVLLLAVKEWRGRPRGDAEPPLPKWMQTIDSFSPAKSAGLAVLLAGPNPKNLMLTVAAGAAIAQAGLSAGQQAIVLAVFVVIATLGPGNPARHLLRARAPLAGGPQRAADLDGAQQPDDHERVVPADRGEDHRRRHRRSDLVMRSG